MADDDVAASSFKNYESAISYLMRSCDWDRRTAHAELCDAVADGLVRIERDPGARPRFDSAAWNPHLIIDLVAPVSILRDGTVINPNLDFPSTRDHRHERYYRVDLQQLAQGGNKPLSPNLPPKQTHPNKQKKPRGFTEGRMPFARKALALVQAGEAESDFAAAGMVVDEVKRAGLARKGVSAESIQIQIAKLIKLL